MYIKDAPNQTVHISFTAKELGYLDSKSNSVGLSRIAYIRRMALEGKAKGYNLKPMVVHAEAVGEVAAAVRDMIAKPHPDRWAYEADIERIEDLLRELVDSEKALMSDMTRRLKR